MVAATLEARVRAALEEVYDPEIPVVRITDLGIVEDVRASDAAIEVDLLPTFTGCPALDAIREDVERAVAPLAEGREVRVTFRRDLAWTSDRISERAREAMKEYGLAPPGERRGLTLVQIRVACPYCGSLDTAHDSTFGPTLCRDIRYCNACRNPFEGFKPK
ncbi:MAG TPA: 1,2-phenylacetyl-CoA epoxidase subunit PaaD [Actinomycetota bacterium]|nr:1,2-phenylacetyl-CoA epoxidase subunit PaaD [Actinomycetota bacterium]